MRLIKRTILFHIMAICLVFPSCKSKMGADIILFNGKIVTVNNNFDIEEAIAIKGDKILAVGSTNNIKKLAGKSTKQIDLMGKTVTPGLIDEHCHPEEASLSELNEKIPDVHSIAEVLNWIGSQAQMKKKGDWIVFNTFFYTRLHEMRPPTLAELDSVAPNNPVFLNGSYGGVINTAAMKASGINESSSNEGLLRDEYTGRLTGFIMRPAFPLLAKPAPPKLTNEEKIQALQTMLHYYNKIGITSITSGLSDMEDFQRYREMAYRGILTVRIFQNFGLRLRPSDSRKELVESLKMMGVVTGDGDEWVKAGRLKVVLDGGILTGTAFMRKPWGERAKEIYHLEDSSFRGIINYTRDQLLDIASAANELGWSFTAHGTGGGSVDRLLDTYEEINKISPIKERRFSIIHGNFYDAKSIKKMKELNVLASCQAMWFYKDADAMKYILGDERVKDFNPFHSLEAGGVMVCGGSDHMQKMDPNTSINPYNPFLSMWSMITRTTENGNVVVPDEAITREDALRMYTINNAYASFDEDIKGSLKKGKLADLLILSNDILNCDINAIREIHPELTMVGGKIVYREE